VAKPTLRQLKEIWYKKLKDKGFKDIEQDEYNLKRWSSEFVRHNHNIDNKEISVRPKNSRQKKDEFEGKRDYYYYAEHFLNDYKFKSERDRIIWEYHINGISAPNISKLLKKVKINISITTVRVITKKLRKTMKEFYFNDKQ